uniref:Leukocyte chemoattractant peptide 9 n=1 Tax=Ovis aries TaxID=9940 RepID=Q7M2Q2_SHEEP
AKVGVAGFGRIGRLV